MSTTNEFLNFVAKHGVFHSRMLSCTGRNAQYLCERYDVNGHDFYRATLCLSAVFAVARCLSICHVG